MTCLVILLSAGEGMVAVLYCFERKLVVMLVDRSLVSRCVGLLYCTVVRELRSRNRVCRRHVSVIPYPGYPMSQQEVPWSLLKTTPSHLIPPPYRHTVFGLILPFPSTPLIVAIVLVFICSICLSHRHVLLLITPSHSLLLHGAYKLFIVSIYLSLQVIPHVIRR